MSEPVLDGYAIQETIVCATTWSHFQAEHVKTWPLFGTSPFLIPVIIGEFSETGFVSITFEIGALEPDEEGDGDAEGDADADVDADADKK